MGVCFSIDTDDTAKPDKANKASKKETSQPAKQKVAKTGTFSKRMIMLGDGAIGKTCLLAALEEPPKEFTDDYEPTIIETPPPYQWKAFTDLKLEYWDTPGQASLENLRALAYPNTNLVLVSYACNDPASLKNVVPVWKGEMDKYLEHAWTILVGCKKDIEHPDVTPAAVEEVAAKINACAFVETSAKSATGIEELKNLIGKVLTLQRNEEARPKWAEWKSGQGDLLLPAYIKDIQAKHAASK